MSHCHSSLSDRTFNPDPHCPKTEKRWPRRILMAVLLSIPLLLVSCAQPARYMIVSEETKDIRLENPDQRYVFLNKEDAGKNPDILALRTKSDVQKYEQKRKEGGNPVEDVLYHLVRGDYKKAEALLVLAQGEHS